MKKARNSSLVVVYDSGSAAPTRIAQAAAENDCDVIFVAADSAHSRDLLPVLRAFGTVVDMALSSRDEIERTLADAHPDGIVTFSEFQLAATADLADRLGLTYQHPGDMPAIVRKDEQRRRFAAKGVDSLRWYTISRVEQLDEALRCVGLPAVVKPVVGASSRHTVSVRTAAEFRATVTEFLSSEPELLLEELLEGRPTPAPWGDYIAVDCVAAAGHVTPLFVTSKFALAEPYRERGGYGATSVEAETVVDEVRDLACSAVRALNIRNGVADVEIKLTTCGPRVIEVNGRLGGWVDDLAVRSGTADPVGVAIRTALGRDVSAQPAHDTTARRGAAIAFHYLVIPPREAVRVHALHGSSRLWHIPHVDRVAVLAEPGASTDWRIGARAAVAAVVGTAPDHDELARTVAAVEALDWIDYA